METSTRNRSEGWQHAKVSGHKNEKDFADSIAEDGSFLTALHHEKFASRPTANPLVEADGSKYVESILDGKSVSKCDVELDWGQGKRVGISLKKSNSGQVWLIGLPRFFKALEHYTEAALPDQFKKGLSLFIGGANLEEYSTEFLGAVQADLKKRPGIADQELNQDRLVAESIKDHFPGIWEETIDYLNLNIKLITQLSFARGLSKNETDWADFIIYNNAPDGHNIFKVDSVVEAASRDVSINKISQGPRNGGSTIQLPTGFMQMHHPQGENTLQFHHSYEKISSLIFDSSPAKA